MAQTTANSRLERYRQALRGLSGPLAWVDLELFDQNLIEIQKRSNGKRLRVGTKSIRVRALQDRILKTFQGSMTMTAGEAVWLHQHGQRDFVVGYPSVNAVEIESALISGADITFMADLPEHLDLYQKCAAKTDIRISIALDLDVSTKHFGIEFGVHRSALHTLDALKKLLQHSRQCTYVDIVGFMGYEAQIAGVQDRAPSLLAPAMRKLKQLSAPMVSEMRAKALEIFKSEGIELKWVNGGGTGSLSTTSQDPSVTEMTVGSGLFSPALFDRYDSFRYEPAAGFALNVSRHSHPNIWTCSGGGYVASGVGPDRAPVPYLPEGMNLLEHEGAGEVQTPIHYSGVLELGDFVFFRHAKAGEMCERFSKVYLIQGDQVVGTAPTYRGEGVTYL